MVPARPVDGVDPTPPAPLAYANGYSHRTRIVGPGTPATFTNFLLRFDMTQPLFRSVAQGGSVAFENGQDFRFELVDGTKLPHHMTAYDPVAGRVRGFVRVPSLTNRLEFFLFTGNATLSSTEENRAGAYIDCLGAWDARTGEDLTVKGAGRTMAMTTVGQSTVIDDAGSYNGSSSFGVNESSPTYLDSLPSITIEVFVDPAETGNTDGAIISIGPPATASDSGAGALIRWDDVADSGAVKAISAKIHSTIGASRVETQANTQFTGPSMLALTWTQGNAAKLWKDGVYMPPSNTPAAPAGTTTFTRGSANARVYLGRNTWAAGNIWWAGAIDEVRIYAGERSQQELAAEKSNYFRPDLEHGYGFALPFGGTEGPAPIPMTATLTPADTTGVMTLATFTPVLPGGGTATVTAVTQGINGGAVTITGGGASVTYTRGVNQQGAFVDEFEYTITVDGRTGKAKAYVAGSAIALSTTYANGYGHRTKYVLPGTSNKNPPTIPNYILRIDETYAQWKSTANGGQVENGTHLDFRVELVDGTKLDHDVTIYAPTTGRTQFEIRIPTFGTADQEFYIYHGKSGLAATEEAVVTPPVTPGNTRSFNLAFPNSFVGRGTPGIAANDTVVGPVAMPDEEDIANAAAVGTTVDLAVLANDRSGTDTVKVLTSVSRPGFTSNSANVRYTKQTGDTYPIEGAYTVAAEGKTAYGTVLVREAAASGGGGGDGDFSDHNGPMENGRPLFMANYEADPDNPGKYRDVRSKRICAPGIFAASPSTFNSFMGFKPGVVKCNMIAYLNPNRVNSWTRLAGGPTWTATGFNDSLVPGNNNLNYLMVNLTNHANVNGTGSWGYDKTAALGLGVTSIPLGSSVSEAQAAARGDAYIINWWKAAAIRLRKQWLAQGSPILIFRWNWEGMNQDTGLQVQNSNGKPNWYVAGLNQTQYNSMMRRCIAIFKEFGPGRSYHVFSPAFQTTLGGTGYTYDSYFEDDNGEVGYTGACFSFHPVATRTTTLERAQQAVTGGAAYPEGAWYPVAAAVAVAKARGIPFMSMESSIGTPFGGAVNHGDPKFFGDAYIALGELFNDPANYGYASYHAALDTDMIVLNKNVTCDVNGHSGNTQGGTVKHNTGGRIYTDTEEDNKDRAIYAHRKYFGRKDLHADLTIPARQ